MKDLKLDASDAAYVIELVKDYFESEGENYHVKGYVLPLEYLCWALEYRLEKEYPVGD